MLLNSIVQRDAPVVAAWATGGRVGIHEFLLGTPKLQGLIYRNAGIEAIYEQAIADGMRTLKQDGISKIFAGLSDYSQLLNVTAE